MADVTTYVKQDLYGGTITAELPAGFRDAGEVRPVPDHEEVWVSQTTDTSIIIAILDRAEPPDHPCTTDLEALRYHYDDYTAPGYVRASQDTPEQTASWETREVDLANLPGAVALEGMGRQEFVPDGQQRMKLETVVFTVICMTLVRLVEQKTDILITVNVPVQNRLALDETDIRYASSWMAHLLETFKIQDFSLFIPEGEVAVEAAG